MSPTGASAHCPVPERGCVGDQPQQVRSSSGVVHSKAFVRQRLLRLTFQAQSRSEGCARMRPSPTGANELDGIKRPVRL